MLIPSAILNICLSIAIRFFFVSAEFIFYYSIKDVLPDQPERSFVSGSRQKISIHDSERCGAQM